MAIAFDVNRPLPENAQKDVEAVARNAGQLVEVLETFTTDRPGLTPAPIFRSIADKLSMTYQEVSRLFSTIENVNDINQTIDDIDQVIGFFESRLSQERAQIVVQNRDSLKKLMNLYNASHPVAISVKAEKLSYLHENLYQDGEIITDIRPVFDAPGENVLEMVIFHSLVLSHYSVGLRAQRTHLAMDAVDLQRLRDACDRAIRKAAALKGALGGKAWAAKILNERGDNA